MAEAWIVTLPNIHRGYSQYTNSFGWQIPVDDGKPQPKQISHRYDGRGLVVSFRAALSIDRPFCPMQRERESGQGALIRGGSSNEAITPPLPGCKDPVKLGYKKA